MLDVLSENLLNTTNEENIVLKPYIFFNGETQRWNCLRDWNLKKIYFSEAPSWQLLFIPEKERCRFIRTDVSEWNADHNLFIQDDITEGWIEYCIETAYYKPIYSDGWVIHESWHTTPLRCGLAAFVH